MQPHSCPAPGRRREAKSLPGTGVTCPHLSADLLCKRRRSELCLSFLSHCKEKSWWQGMHGAALERSTGLGCSGCLHRLGRCNLRGRKPASGSREKEKSPRTFQKFSHPVKKKGSGAHVHSCPGTAATPHAALTCRREENGREIYKEEGNEACKEE